MSDQVLRMPTRSVGLKFLLVCALALLMFIPIGFVMFVSQDRQNRWTQAIAEVGREEGGAQTIVGPAILVPYSWEVRDEKGRVTVNRGEAFAFAETGKASARLETSLRKRGMYEAPVYSSRTQFDASFDLRAIEQALREMDPNVSYDLANGRIVMGYSSAIGAVEAVSLEIEGAAARPFKPVTGGAASPGQVTGGGEAVASGIGFSLISAPFSDAVVAGKPLVVSAAVRLTGAERFGIGAFAKNTSVRMEGDWPDPKLEGFRASERTITEKGFKADWNAPYIRRGIPEVGPGFGVLNQVANSDFAVRFVQPTNAYTGIDRALKYAMMFIGLVFLAYFLFEIVSGARAHPAQYIMVGLSQAIFYLLLLAFAEQIGFTPAFGIAAGATIFMLSYFAAVVFKRAAYFLPALLIFTLTYALVYVLMTLEDYALMVGALVSFAALLALMHFTRNVSWYGAEAAPARGEGASSPRTDG